MPNYTNNPGFLGELSAMARDKPEGLTAGLWNVILNEWFPSEEGYTHRAQWKHDPGYSDFKSNHWVSRPGSATPVQCQFLVVQVKKYARTQDRTAWSQGEMQLNTYVRSLIGKDTFRHRIYGILAVGRVARFYFWNFDKGGLDYLDSHFKTYDVVNDVRKVERFLDSIKIQHDKELRRR